jgi:hypothetical protein
VAKALGISSGNEFKLLDALGGDVAGALTFWPEGATPVLPDSGVATEPLSDDELVNLLDSLPMRPFLAGKCGFRLSLAVKGFGCRPMPFAGMASETEGLAEVKPSAETRATRTTRQTPRSLSSAESWQAAKAFSTQTAHLPPLWFCGRHGAN